MSSRSIPSSHSPDHARPPPSHETRAKPPHKRRRVAPEAARFVPGPVRRGERGQEVRTRTKGSLATPKAQMTRSKSARGCDQSMVHLGIAASDPPDGCVLRIGDGTPSTSHSAYLVARRCGALLQGVR